MKRNNIASALAVMLVILGPWQVASAEAELVGVTAIEQVAAGAEPGPQATQEPARGAVTQLPLPRYVTLKTGEGNARRGPGLAHRIDWVFKRAGMPLMVTAEHENWRRVEDAEGAGGWVHYTLLSGTRSILVTEDMAEVRSSPQAGAQVVMQAEAGVVARLLACRDGWCRVATPAGRGWLPERSIWGVAAQERLD